MQLQSWGAAYTVTGSMHVLSANGHRLLLDCGMFQGKRKEAFERNRNIPFDAAEIDAVLLSHAHIDHSGNLPSLVKAGFEGSVYATPATRDLCATMLRDSAHIQVNDVKYVNKRRRRAGKREFEPLYDLRDVVRTLGHFVTSGYGRAFEPVPGVEVRFLDAGHILGSAVTVIDVMENGVCSRLVFTGDIGRRGLPILRDPQVPTGTNYLLTESTYGAREHETHDEAREKLREIVADTYGRGGKVIIPSFAVGRTQEIVHALDTLWREDAIPPVPIYVDSPLAVNVTDIFRLHPECYAEEFKEFLQEDTDEDPFGFERLEYIRDVEDSKALNDMEEPAVIVSASGMCEAGRILHHLKNNIDDPRNTVLFVGYQAENTLGRKILDGENPVKIFGIPHEVRARIESAEGYSAHAGRSGLLQYAENVREKGDLRGVFLVHGSEENLLSFKDGLEERGFGRIEIPERGGVIEL